MFDDPLNRSTEHEPDDPETKYAPDIPSVSIPDTSDVDVPPELAQAFWRVVVAVNIGVFAVSLGLMLVYFRGEWQLGGSAVALGIVTLIYGYLRYWRAIPDTTPETEPQQKR
ncbi:MAG TPA: hypothetical protein VFJ06_01240 [Halococcus sp.]|nr:hypothetical protein [Halococcus sp.]